MHVQHPETRPDVFLDADPRLAAGVAQAGTGRFESWPGIENGYDAVWAAASAFAKAAASMKSDPNAPENRKELRSLAYKALVTPGEIDFSGASGRVLFNDHGGRLDDSVAVEFQNFAGLPGSSEATVQVVGCWSDVDGVRLNSSSPIRFANGMVYPEVGCPEGDHLARR